MVNRYQHSAGAYSLSYADGWSVCEKGDKTFLWLDKNGGAITICVFQAQEPSVVANALEQCRRLLKLQRQDENQSAGDFRLAQAAFVSDDGIHWFVKTIASGGRFLLVTYNYARYVEEEFSQAMFAILSICMLQSE